MITENLSTLKIHKLTQAQYDRELAAGRIDQNALYLTPDEQIKTEKEIYVQNDEPVDATDGTVWIDVDAEQHPTSGVISIPTVTVDDNGKFMMVVNGRWEAVALPNGEGVSF